MIVLTTTTEHAIYADRHNITTFKGPSSLNPEGYFVVWSKTGKEEKKFLGFWIRKGDDRGVDLSVGKYNVAELIQNRL